MPVSGRGDGRVRPLAGAPHLPHNMRRPLRSDNAGGRARPGRNASCDGQVRVVDDGDVGDADDLLNNSGLDIANANANVPSNLLRLPSDITLAKTPGMHAIS